jgi:peptidoglycan hydrolase-like protein with peptidoglycan-binding domain
MPAAPDAATTAAPADRQVAIAPGSDAERTLAFRRSLRASRTRRMAAALRRRRILRSRGSALVAAAGLFVVTGGAIAQQQLSPSAGGGLTADTIAAAQKALGVAADGVVGPQTRRATRSFQRSNALTVDGVIGPQTLKALGVEPGAAREASAGAAGSVLERIAACESGGDPTAVSADGQYRGKYQFSRETWRLMGGSGDPAAAPEAEQDKRAAMLMEQAGSSSWPVCSQQV